MDTIGLNVMTLTSFINKDSLAAVANQLDTLERLIARYAAHAFFVSRRRSRHGKLPDMRRHAQPRVCVLQPPNMKGEP